MLSKISFGKRSNRHSECVPQAIRIVGDAAALGAIRYTRGLRAKIFPRPDFQTK